jgi:RNA polymerase sigma-70 factor (ECF subfamily)
MDIVDQSSDRSLLQLYASHRDLIAFEALIDRHQSGLLRLAHALLTDSHAAQDAVQEVFMRLCQQSSTLVKTASTSDSLGGWLCTVLRHHCIDLIRKRAFQKMQRMHIELQDGGPLTEHTNVDSDQLWGAVGSLPALERAVVVLRYRDGLSYQEIARQMGKTTTHVGVLLHSALGRLRQRPSLRAEHS